MNAAMVRAAVESEKNSRGSFCGMVFVSWLWASLVDAEQIDIDLETFRAELLALYVAGEVTLAKADMPQAFRGLQATLCRESTIHDGNRELCFVR